MIRLDKQPGESQADFCERCHRTLEGQIPETDRRNSVCLQMCRDAGFDQTPVQRFSEREFHLVRDVPVFAEHTTKDRDGNLVVYDRNALAVIADRCNERIADTGDYPPITEGHTPTKDEIAQGAKMPDVLGYAGNFRLGQIGNKNPRWAIFCDEFHHIEDKQKLRKLRRRSPEVWLEERMEDRFFDPIAALGAETPRLDMGMARFARTQDGRVVEKYTAALPSATDGYIPGGDDDKQSQFYNADAEGTAMISPEDINQIIEGLMQTAPMQWVQEQMAAGAPPAEGGDMPPAAGIEEQPTPDEGNEFVAPPAAPNPGPGDAPPAAPAAAPPAAEPPAYEPDDDDKAAFSRYMAGEMDDEEMNQYMAGKKANYQADSSCGDDDMTTGTESYSRDARQQERLDKARYAKLEAKVQELEAKAAKAEAERQKAERYSKLNELHHEFAFDLEKEVARAEKMSDEQFENHLDCITENYSRVPMDGSMPRVFAPDIQRATREDSEKAAKYSRRAVQIATAAANAGKPISHEEAVMQAKKEIDAA